MLPPLHGRTNMPTRGHPELSTGVGWAFQQGHERKLFFLLVSPKKEQRVSTPNLQGL